MHISWYTVNILVKCKLRKEVQEYTHFFTMVNDGGNFAQDTRCTTFFAMHYVVLCYIYYVHTEYTE